MTGMTNVTKLASEPSGQEFLVFTLGDEEYGIDILKVQEIRGYDQVTRIANTPAFIKGVTNLRGVIVPIVDLCNQVNHLIPTRVLVKGGEITCKILK